MPPLILITRPRDSAEDFAANMVETLGQDVDILVAPLMKIEHLDTLPELESIKTLIFTSAHAVHAFCAASERRDFTCYAVGDTTGRCAREHGFHPIVGPGNGKALAQQICKHSPPAPCLYLRGNFTAYDIANTLKAAGIETQSAIVYQQVDQPLTQNDLEKIRRSGPIIAPVFSPRSAERLFDALPANLSPQIAAISDAVAAVIPPDRAGTILVSKTPDRNGMLTCVATLWRNANALEGGSTAQ